MSTVAHATREDHFVVFRAFEKAGIKVTYRGRERVNLCLIELLKAQAMHSEAEYEISIRIENHRDRQWNTRKTRTPEEKKAVRIGYTNSKGVRKYDVCLWCIVTVKEYTYQEEPERVYDHPNDRGGFYDEI